MIPNFSAVPDFLEQKGMIFDRKYQEILSHMGLDSFESVWHHQGGETIKQIQARSVICIEGELNGEKTRFFLKKHTPEKPEMTRLPALFFPSSPLSQGMKEFRNMCDFRKHGIWTAPPVAAGEKFMGRGQIASFLITEDAAPFVSLEDLLRNQPEFFKGREGAARKKHLLHEIALWARKMHQSGFNHRDFNATHILLGYDEESDIPKLALFDLQRVDRKSFLRFFWMIKTLAELSYTLSDTLFDEKDRTALFLSYREKTALNLWDRLQLAWVRRKTDRIRCHTENILARRAERRRKGLPER